MSSTLPSSDQPDEQDNAQYIELKRLIPPELIINDITARKQNLVIKSPTHGKTVFEFRSSKQELQDLGKIPLSSVWHDEETPESIRNECKARLVDEGGDEVFTLTPTNPLSYTFDQVWDRATLIYRSKAIVAKYGGKQVQHRNTGYDIACIQSATDDNPILTLEDIEAEFGDIVDPDELAIRRYGVFKAISGRVHKTYDPSICYIAFDDTFPEGIPYEWFHARGVDYHESRLPWSILWLAASPQDEWFFWKEFHPAIDGPNAYNTYEIVKAMARQSEGYEYKVNLIDPLASKKQANSGFSTIDDMNRHFHEFQQMEGLGRPCYWEAWDTKGTTGRDEIAKRFKNAVRCGRPFNNAVKEKGNSVLPLRGRKSAYLPTAWLCDTCPKSHQSVLKWRFGEYVAVSTKAVNDPKPTPQQKSSHDCMCMECMAKDQRILHATELMRQTIPQQEHRRVSVTGR